jgi:hypothetical protein
MNAMKTDARGAITFWVPSPCPIDKLREVLDELGGKPCPKRSAISALRAAEREVSGSASKSAIFSRKSPSKNGVEVHKVTRKADQVQTERQHGCRIDEDNGRWEAGREIACPG